MQVGKAMLIFRPALKNECRSEENYSWSAKLAITSNGEHCIMSYYLTISFYFKLHFDTNYFRCNQLTLSSFSISAPFTRHASFIL